jgi:PIN domain nuclease of toxin-antitoxin system
MNLLLDTHILLWHLEDDARLSLSRSEIIEDDERTKFLSIATIWEKEHWEIKPPT